MPVGRWAGSAAGGGLWPGAEGLKIRHPWILSRPARGEGPKGEEKGWTRAGCPRSQGQGRSRRDGLRRHDVPGAVCWPAEALVKGFRVGITGRGCLRFPRLAVPDINSGWLSNGAASAPPALGRPGFPSVRALVSFMQIDQRSRARVKGPSCPPFTLSFCVSKRLPCRTGTVRFTAPIEAFRGRQLPS